MLRIANATLLATTLSCGYGSAVLAANVEPRSTELDRVAQLIAENDFDNAKAEASALIVKHARAVQKAELNVAGGAYAALGRIYATEASRQEAQGRKLWANNAYADARWAYLNAMTYLVTDDEQAAAALVQAGVCYSRLSGIETDAGENAVRTWKAVLRWYPKSAAATQARTELRQSGAKVDE
jgi:hypothetical protein